MDMRRREFLGVLGGAVAARPFMARAQQPTMPVIGFIRSTSAGDSADLVAALRQGLKEVGYVEGQNIAIEYRWAAGRNDRIPELVADLVRRPVAVLIAANNAVMVAAKATAATIPIVFATGDDPVKLGFVASLSRPTGNITGVTFYSGVLVAKQLELLREMLPRVAVIGILVNPTSPAAETQIRDAQAAAHALALQIHIANASSEREFDAAFANFVQKRVDGVIFGGDALFTGQRERLVALATHHALPTVYVVREFAAAGGLMSYGASIADAFRQIGVYTGRILKGAKPAELPVMLPTKFELVINLKTAKTLGLEVPWFLQQRADELIE
jgi:putative ABC transport system substrate-binding protein